MAYIKEYRYFGLFTGNTIVLNPYNPGNPNQQWERADPFVRSRATPNKVLDIASEYCVVLHTEIKLLANWDKPAIRLKRTYLI